MAIVAGATLLVAAAPLVALVIRSFSTPTGWSASAWTDLGRSELRPGIRVGVDPFEAMANSLVNAAWATGIGDRRGRTPLGPASSTTTSASTSSFVFAVCSIPSR